MLEQKYLIGIDLGTTNTAVAYVDTREPVAGDTPKIHIFNIPQLVAEGEVEALPALPSFLLFTSDGDASSNLRLPWDERPETVVGVFAREQGALVPGRQVSSAKSWLCHDAVDRTARILPWGAESPEHSCSPVEASTRYLEHIRNAWNHKMANPLTGGDEDSRFERQEIVLTVPASFDEEARELTVWAARKAGIVNLTLLEEPLAAFYAWIATHRRTLKRYVADGNLVLVCDVGGGTTDFSLIRVRIIDGEVRFERTAIGEHLLLGGDNVDLALARRVEEKLGNSTARPKLSLRQQNALRRQCCAAKERLLSDGRLKRAAVTVLGSGSSVVGGALSAELTREEVEETLDRGFLPLTSLDDLPARERRTGLRELGLPYASEPAITKHLAAFLKRSGGGWESGRAGERESGRAGEWESGRVGERESGRAGERESGRAGERESGRAGERESDDPQSAIRNPQSSVVRPDAILFNGGFFTPALTRERIVEAVANWFRLDDKEWRPKVLSNKSLECAVAVGAAYYGHVRRGGGLRVSGGSARAYYIGVQTEAREAEGRVQAVCVLPRGIEEGTTLELADREFTVLANRPVSFTLYSSTVRHDAHGEIVTLNEEEVHRHAPLITVLRYGKKSRHAELSVRLSASFTEVGTLELWCESLKTDHRWRLQFQLRGAEQPAELEEEPDVEADEDSAEKIEGKNDSHTWPQVVIPDEIVDRVIRLIRAVFGRPHDAIEGESAAPETLTSRFEALFGYGKDAWPLAVIRRLADALIEVSDGRKKGPKYEVRWLNLYGFCLRPGFGAPADDWRISQSRKIYLAGLAFQKDLQCQVEWLVLWRRVAGGLNANHHHELHNKIRAALGLGGKRSRGRINTQIERESWRLLASLEHLAASARVALGKELLHGIKEQPTNQSFLWSLGRLGARIPLYGPLNCVVPAVTAAEWIIELLNLPEITHEAASAIVQLGARTKDPLRDIDESLRERAIEALNRAGVSDDVITALREYVPTNRQDAARTFGESLPMGLRLVS